MELPVAVDVKSLVELGKKYPCQSFFVASPAAHPASGAMAMSGGTSKGIYNPSGEAPALPRLPHGLHPTARLLLSSFPVFHLDHPLFARDQNSLLPFYAVSSRQNQQYWYRGLLLQAQRLRNVRCPDMHTIKEIITSGFIPRAM